MEINPIEVNGEIIAEFRTEEVIISSVRDALDILGAGYGLDAKKYIVHEKNIVPEFFDLSTRLAGDILQKFSNYGVRLAIVGDFSKYPGQSLKDFIYECNNSRRICFADSVGNAVEMLTK